MKQYIIVGVVVVSAFVFSFFFVMDYDDAGHSQLLQATATPTNHLEKKLDELANTIGQQLRNYSDLIEQTRNEQSRVNDVIASLEARIYAAETLQSQQSNQTDDSSGIVQELAQEANNDEQESSDSNKINERAMGRWMDDILSSGYLDDAATFIAADQVERGVVNTPGMQLLDMLCTEKFCRASFAREDGELPDIGSLLGSPPFVNEGFTVNNPDGTVTVYFTDTGISLSELQNEASQEQMN